MKLFIKKNPNNNKAHYSTGRKVEIKNITNDSFDISVWTTGNVYDDETIYDFEKNPSFSVKINKNDVLFDSLSKNVINDDHVVVTGYIPSFSKETIKFINLFSHTKQVKSSIGYILSSLGITPLFFIVIPFKDSLIEDWTFISDTREFIADGENVSEEINLDGGITAAQGFSKLFPTITLSKNNNEITAQLSVAKSGVELHFETTAGYLNKTRAITDESGAATVKVFGEELEGKVKVGFKHFSGKEEISI